MSVCPALSADRDVRGTDLIMVSLPPPASHPPLLLLRSSIQTHTHTQTKQIRGNAPKQLNTSVCDSL